MCPIYFSSSSLLVLLRTRSKIRSRLVCFFTFEEEMAAEAGVAADCTFLVAVDVDAYLLF